MARERVLITGGAGFLGGHLADPPLGAAHRRLLDHLPPGERANRPGAGKARAPGRQPKGLEHQAALPGIMVIAFITTKLGVQAVFPEIIQEPPGPGGRTWRCCGWSAGPTRARTG